MGVAGTPALASQTLAEQIALWNCFCGATPSSPPLPAAQFASSAQSPTDFVAMFNFYSTVSAVDPAPGAPASLWTALTPLAFPHLACPTCDPQTPNDNLAAFIAAQFAQSGPIGFPTLAVALAEIAAHSGLPLTGPLPADAALAINLYLSNVSALVAASASGSSAPPRITLLQDGLTRWIDYANDASLARFQLDPSGLISLRRFAPSAPAQ